MNWAYGLLAVATLTWVADVRAAAPEQKTPSTKSQLRSHTAIRFSKSAGRLIALAADDSSSRDASVPHSSRTARAKPDKGAKHPPAGAKNSLFATIEVDSVTTEASAERAGGADATDARVAPSKGGTFENRRQLASALNPVVVPKQNPYGDMYDTRSLRPYKPGVRYERRPDERDSSFFGLLFGNGRR